MWFHWRWPQTNPPGNPRASADWSLQTGEWFPCTWTQRHLGEPAECRHKVRTNNVTVSMHLFKMHFIYVSRMIFVQFRCNCQLAAGWTPSLQLKNWKLKCLATPVQFVGCLMCTKKDQKNRKGTLAPPDCSNRLKPDSLLWSMFSMTVHPLNAPWRQTNKPTKKIQTAWKQTNRHSCLLCMTVLQLTSCLVLACRVFLQRMPAKANLLCWEVMEGRTSRMQLLPHSYSSSLNTDREKTVTTQHRHFLVL